MTDLIKKQHEEMQKLRDEMSLKMKSIRESHQKDIMKILTEEQKKFVETSAYHSGVRK
jgi:Spy/CpxP family protein refolding chaperone